MNQDDAMKKTREIYEDGYAGVLHHDQIPEEAIIDKIYEALQAERDQALEDAATLAKKLEDEEWFDISSEIRAIKSKEK